MAKKKATARKTAKKKTAARKKTTARKKTVKARPKAKPAGNKPRTKSEIFRELSEDTGLARKEVAAVFESMANLIQKDVSKRGIGAFTIPGLVKLKTIRKPATKSRKGINPFTGEEAVFKAKPARSVVKARPLKALKDMV